VADNENEFDSLEVEVDVPEGITLECEKFPDFYSSEENTAAGIGKAVRSSRGIDPRLRKEQEELKRIVTFMKGKQGPQGPAGPTGPEGPRGPVGPQGSRGRPARRARRGRRDRQAYRGRPFLRLSPGRRRVLSLPPGKESMSWCRHENLLTSFPPGRPRFIFLQPACRVGLPAALSVFTDLLQSKRALCGGNFQTVFFLKRQGPAP
jgi:hypothetical protein